MKGGMVLIIMLVLGGIAYFSMQNQGDAKGGAAEAAKNVKPPTAGDIVSGADKGAAEGVSFIESMPPEFWSRWLPILIGVGLVFWLWKKPVWRGVMIAAVIGAFVVLPVVTK